MSLQFHARLTADGKQAKVEIRGTADELQKLSAGLEGVTADGRETADALSRIEAAAARAAVKMNDTRGGADGVSHSTKVAAGSVGNLTAQFNDIGVMLAAGQNPLQLAVQQGTQITQVLGPMGAGQAVRALGGAFMSLLSPINLVTIGGIAAGAALVQWMTRSREETEDFTGAVEAAREKTAELRRENELRLSGFATQEEKTLSEAVQRAQAELARAEKLRQAAGGRNAGDTSRADAARAEVEAAEKALAAYREQEALAERLNALHEDAASLWDGISGTAADYLSSRVAEYSAAQDMLVTMREENELRRIALDHGEDSIEYAAARADAERRAFEETLATLDVSEALKDELRAAFENGLALSGVDMASGIATAASSAAQLAQNLGISVQSASRLMAIRQQTGSGDPVVFDPRDPRYDPVAAEAARMQDSYNRTSPFDPSRIAVPRVSSRGGRSGGGGRSAAARAARKERDAVKELIDGKREELAILRETDPVQKEMLRNRDAMADATEAERAELRKLIEDLKDHERAASEANDQYRFFADTALDVLPDIAKGGDAATSALERLADSIQRAAWEAILLGEGPLSTLLYGPGGGAQDGGLGGLAGAAFSALFPNAATKVQGRADGGMIYGPGGSRDDRVPVMMSPGEMAINAAATARHRHLLEAINAGAPLPGLASGGTVGSDAISAQGMSTLIVETPPGLPLDAKLEERRGPGGERMQRLVLSEAVAGGLAAPGGAARKSLREGYGLTRRGVLR